MTSGDYLLIDRGFVLQGAPISAEFLAAREARFGGGYVAALVAAVPEPASVGPVIGGVMLLTRRCRRR